MNFAALAEVTATLNKIQVFQPESLYIWLRTMLGLATCNALMGSRSPFRTDPSLIDAVW